MHGSEKQPGCFVVNFFFFFFQQWCRDYKQLPSQEDGAKYGGKEGLYHGGGETYMLGKEFWPLCC